MKSHDTSDKLLVQRYGNGIKLVPPEQADIDSLPHLYCVARILEMPFSIYFLNPDSTILHLNEHSALSCGFQSQQDAIGKNISAVTTQEVARLKMSHTSSVMQLGDRVMKDTYFQRASDGAIQTKIDIKFPWYNNADEVIGVVGISVILDDHAMHSPAHAFASIMQTGLLTHPAKQPTNVPALDNTARDNNGLTWRQQECLYHLAQGMTVKQIARETALSPRTVGHYLDAVKQKLGCGSRTELIKKALDMLVLKEKMLQQL